MDLTIHAEGFIISFGIYSSVNQITRLFLVEIGTRCGIEQLLSITSTFLACPLCLMRKMASIWRASVICMDFNLSDPFRTLYPGWRAFSYSPFGTVRRNRSRLDFFVVSNSLIPNIIYCSISPGRATKLFDHRTVLLTLGTKKKGKTNSGPRVGNTFLTESYVRASVNLAAIKCHVHSLWV